MNHLNPLNIFLRQEIDRMQKVITIVRHTLNDLLLAVEGTIIMSEVLGLNNQIEQIEIEEFSGPWRRFGQYL